MRQGSGRLVTRHRFPPTPDPPRIHRRNARTVPLPSVRRVCQERTTGDPAVVARGPAGKVDQQPPFVHLDHLGGVQQAGILGKHGASDFILGHRKKYNQQTDQPRCREDLTPSTAALGTADNAATRAKLAATRGQRRRASRFPHTESNGGRCVPRPERRRSPAVAPGQRGPRVAAVPRALAIAPSHHRATRQSAVILCCRRRRRPRRWLRRSASC